MRWKQRCVFFFFFFFFFFFCCSTFLGGGDPTHRATYSLLKIPLRPAGKWQALPPPLADAVALLDVVTGIDDEFSLEAAFSFDAVDSVDSGGYSVNFEGFTYVGE